MNQIETSNASTRPGGMESVLSLLRNPFLEGHDRPEEQLPPALIGILQKRTLPGLAIFHPSGELLLTNTTAAPLLRFVPGGGYTKVYQTIRDQLARIIVTRSAVRSGGPLPAGKMPILETLVHWNGYWYGIHGFWMRADFEVEAGHVVAVLIEPVNTTRLDVDMVEARYNLSRREVEVIRKLAMGMMDKEIACTLGVSPETVRSYLKSVRNKLGVSTRTGILHKLLFE